MSKMLLGALIFGILVSNIYAKNGEFDIYPKRDIYVLADSLSNEQKSLLYGRYMNVGTDIGGGIKGFYVKDIPQIKEAIDIFQKANKLEKELREY